MNVIFLLFILSVIFGILAGIGFMWITEYSFVIAIICALVGILLLFYIYYDALKKVLDKNSSIIWGIFFVIMSACSSFLGFVMYSIYAFMMEF